MLRIPAFYRLTVRCKRLLGDLGLIPDVTAGYTALSMDADYSTAFRTPPSFLLPRDKSLESKLLYALKILYHAHAVFRSVASVQLP